MRRLKLPRLLLKFRLRFVRKLITNQAPMSAAQLVAYPYSAAVLPPSTAIAQPLR
jgi:hypothetical protein